MRIAAAILLIIQSFAFAASAQETRLTDDLVLAPGVKRHAGLDDVYRRFSKAYRDLDAAAFSALYTKDAAYLVPGSEIVIGSENIVRGFDRFFDAVRRDNARITISFRIVQRTVDGRLGYDVGIYTLRTFKEDKEVSSGRGKFVVVALQDGGQWKFQVDGYNDLPAPEPPE